MKTLIFSMAFVMFDAIACHSTQKYDKPSEAATELSASCPFVYEGATWNTFTFDSLTNELVCHVTLMKDSADIFQKIKNDTTNVLDFRDLIFDVVNNNYSYMICRKFGEFASTGYRRGVRYEVKMPDSDSTAVYSKKLNY